MPGHKLPRCRVRVPVNFHLPLDTADDLPGAIEITATSERPVRERPRYLNAVRTMDSDQFVDFPLNGSSV